MLELKYTACPRAARGCVPFLCPPVNALPAKAFMLAPGALHGKERALLGVISDAPGCPEAHRRPYLTAPPHSQSREPRFAIAELQTSQQPPGFVAIASLIRA